MATTDYYGSEHAATIYSLLNKVEEQMNDIHILMTNYKWEQANTLTWNCGIELDVCRDIMKCPPSTTLTREYY